MNLHSIYLASKSLRWASSSVILCAGLLSASGCGGSGGDATPTAPPAAPVASVSVTLPASTIEIGSTTTASATVLNASGTPISDKSVVWSSDNTLAATVSSAGVVTGVNNGTANIIATVDGKQGQAAATIVTSSKWKIDATILTNADYGGAAGPIADVAVVKLNDGRYRMWLNLIPGNGGRIVSAISSDGIKFTPESGVRIPQQPDPFSDLRVSHPFVMRLDDGRIRLFGHSTTQGVGAGMWSFTSVDEGVTFTLDPLLFSGADVGMTGLTGSAIIKVKSGGWRMYFSSSDQMTFTRPPIDFIKSSFSTDLVNWKVDPGVRIGAGSTLTGSALHPGAILNDDGSVTLVYTRFFDLFTFASYSATSADGLNFTTESQIGFWRGAPASNATVAPNPAGDPFLMRLPNGDVRMYYNWGDDVVGNIYVAHRRGFSLTNP